MWLLIKNSSDGAQNFIKPLAIYDDLFEADLIASGLNYDLGNDYLEFYVESFPKNLSFGEVKEYLT